MLQNYTGVLWVDSSIEFTSSNFSDVFHKAVQETQGVVLLSRTYASIFAVTHPNMYKFIPSKIDLLKQIEQWESNSILLYRTDKIYNHVIKWWVICALQKECFAPILTLHCTFENGERYNNFSNCHRFDQSAITVLLSNLFAFNEKK